MDAKQAANGKTMNWVLAAGMMVALVSLPAVASAKGKCDPSTCSTNSPVVDGAAIEGQAFHELSVAGEANAAGFVVTGIRKPGARRGVDGAATEDRTFPELKEGDSHAAH